MSIEGGIRTQRSILCRLIGNRCFLNYNKIKYHKPTAKIRIDQMKISPRYFLLHFLVFRLVTFVSPLSKVTSISSGLIGELTCGVKLLEGFDRVNFVTIESFLKPINKMVMWEVEVKSFRYL